MGGWRGARGQEQRKQQQAGEEAGGHSEMIPWEIEDFRFMILDLGFGWARGRARHCMGGFLSKKKFKKIMKRIVFFGMVEGGENFHHEGHEKNVDNIGKVREWLGRANKAILRTIVH